jgi:cytochrome P450
MDFTGPDVQAILADPRFVPPPAPPAGPVGTMAWLRASVARFTAGPEHARLRAIVEAELARLNPEELRTRAAESDMDPRYIPVAVLASALGIADVAAAVTAVRAVAAAYQGVYEVAPDAAVAHLVSALPEANPDVTANRIGILVQACDSTAALIAAADGMVPVAELVMRQPPVRVTRRKALEDVRIGEAMIPAGTIVTLDISELPFGGKTRLCPGRRHALALAAGSIRPPGDQPRYS